MQIQLAVNWAVMTNFEEWCGMNFAVKRVFILQPQFCDVSEVGVQAKRQYSW